MIFFFQVYNTFPSHFQAKIICVDVISGVLSAYLTHLCTSDRPHNMFQSTHYNAPHYKN